MKQLKLAIAALCIMLLSSFTISKTAMTAVHKLEGSDSQIEFRIQLATYDHEAPIAEVDKLLSIDGVSFMESKGKTVFVTEPYQTEDEASMKLSEYRQMGYKQAVKVVIVEGYVVTSRVFHLMYDNRKTSAAEKYKLFTPEVKVINVQPENL